LSAAIVTQLPDSSRSAPVGGNVVPQSGKTTSTAGVVLASSVSSGGGASKNAPDSGASASDPQSLVDQVNKYLNDSGRPDQFRVDPDSDKYIQQVNPATGVVVAEYLASEFPALARSVGASGLLVDETA
jgi:hypothetical protein